MTVDGARELDDERAQRGLGAGGIVARELDAREPEITALVIGFELDPATIRTCSVVGRGLLE